MPSTDLPAGILSCSRLKHLPRGEGATADDGTDTGAGMVLYQTNNPGRRIPHPRVVVLEEDQLYSTVIYPEPHKERCVAATEINIISISSSSSGGAAGLGAGAGAGATVLPSSPTRDAPARCRHPLTLLSHICGFGPRSWMSRGPNNEDVTWAVFFFKPYCGACRRIKPTFEALVSERNRVTSQESP